MGIDRIPQKIHKDAHIFFLPFINFRKEDHNMENVHFLLKIPLILFLSICQNDAINWSDEHVFMGVRP